MFGNADGVLDALEHHVEVEIRNNLSSPASIEVRERVPVKIEGDDQIEIYEKDVIPKWEPYEQDDAPIEGGRIWSVELAVGEKRTLAARYVVHISSKHELIGGNRRES